MLIGLLCLGMVFGMVAAIGALIAGYSILAAVAVYATTGAFTVLLSVPALAIFQRVRPLPPRQHRFSD